MSDASGPESGRASEPAGDGTELIPKVGEGAAAPASATAGTMPMPKVGGAAPAPTMPMPLIRPAADDAAMTKPMPRVLAEADSARTVPIPNVVADSRDVITNAVRDAAAAAMTMPMPAVQADVAPHGAPTEPLPVLRDGDPAPEPDQGSDSEADNASGGTAADSGSDAQAADRVSVGSGVDDPPRSDPEESSPDRAEPAGPPSSDDSDSEPASPDLPRPAVLAEAATVSFRRLVTTEIALPETVAEVVAVVDAASKAIAAAEDAARQVAEATAAETVEVAAPAFLDLREPAQPAPVDGVLELLAPVLERPLLVVEQPALPAAPDLMALHRAEFELDFAEPPVVAAGDEPPIPTRFGPGLAVLPHIEFPV